MVAFTVYAFEFNLRSVPFVSFTNPNSTFQREFKHRRDLTSISITDGKHP